MALDATKSHIFQELFSIKILTKLTDWAYHGTTVTSIQITGPYRWRNNLLRKYGI